MMFRTHLFSTLVVGMPIWVVVEGSLPCYLSGLVMGAALPDLEEKKSFIGVRMRLISEPLSLLVKHRSITHTLVAAIGVFFVLLYFLRGQMCESLAYGVGLGVLFHSLGDMSTKEGGIPLLYPFLSVRLYVLPRLLRYKTGGVFERFILSPFFAMLFFLELLLCVAKGKIPAM